MGFLLRSSSLRNLDVWIFMSGRFFFPILQNCNYISYFSQSKQECQSVTQEACYQTGKTCAHLDCFYNHKLLFEWGCPFKSTSSCCELKWLSIKDNPLFKTLKWCQLWKKYGPLIGSRFMLREIVKKIYVNSTGINGVINLSYNLT